MLKRDKGKKCIRIVDFGLMAVHEYSDQTHSSDKGNYDYIAPEVYDGRIYDTKADIYSFGIIWESVFIMNNLLHFKHKSTIVKNCLFLIYDYTLTYSDSSNDIIELLVNLMSKQSKIADIQLNAIKCLYNLTKDELEEKISQQLLGNAVEVTLTSSYWKVNSNTLDSIGIKVSGIGIQGNWDEMKFKSGLNIYEQRQKSNAINSTEIYNESCIACFVL